MQVRRFQRGGFAFDAIMALAAAAFIASLIAWAYNLAEHFFVDPKQKLWDQEKVILVANQKTCQDANAKLITEFKGLTDEFNKIAKDAEDSEKARAANYRGDVEREVQRRIKSQPKIDDLRARSATASAEKTELGRCRAAQSMLNDYAVDVQKLRAVLFPQVDITGPTRVVPGDAK